MRTHRFGFGWGPALVGVLLMTLAGCWAKREARHQGKPTGPLQVGRQGRIWVVGHRGARAKLPENTLPGFLYAVRLGVDAVELDVHTTKDRQLIVTHDALLDAGRTRLAGKELSQPVVIVQSTLENLRRYDVGSVRHPRFPGQQLRPNTPMPTLAEVFDGVAKSKHPAARRLIFDIEIKSKPEYPQHYLPPAELAELVLAQIEAHGLQQRAIVRSFDHRVLVAARAQQPTLTIAALTDQRQGYAKLAQRLAAQIVSPDHRQITRADVAAIHRAGSRVMPYTVNGAEDWQRMVDLGVDGIITDDPAELIRFLQGKGLR